MSREAEVERAPSGFFGRERELDELRGALEDALKNRGRLCLLTGDAGIGKSRLAEELATLAGDRGVRVLWGRCWHDAGAPAFWPWVQVLRTYLHGCPADQLAEAGGRGAPQLAQLVPEIAERLDIEPAKPSTDPEFARFELFDAVSTFFRVASAVTPMTLVFDDLHWADHSSLLLLSFLTRDIADSNLFVLCTYRDVEVQADQDSRRLLADAGRHGVTVPLRGLDEAGVTAFVQSGFGVGLTPELAASLHRLTGGNPFFVGEVVRVLATEGRLRKVSLTDLGVPAGVGESVRRRLALCAVGTREVLTVATTVGATFSLSVVERASGLGRAEILEALQEALSLRILAGGTLGSYAFSHALIREAIYEDLPPSRRAELHRSVGEAIEELSGPSVDGHLRELAHHFFQASLAGDAGKAVEYAERAGRRATELLAYEEAARHFEQGLRALELDGSNGTRRCRLLIALGDALWRAGDRRSSEVFLEAAELARALDDGPLLGEAALGYGAGLGGEGFTFRVDEALVEYLEEALDRIGQEHPALRIRLLARLAVELYWSDDAARRRDCAEQAVAAATRLGDPRLLLVALHSQQWALHDPDTLEGRLAAGDRMVELADEVGDVEMSYRGRHVRFTTLLELGDTERGRRELEECAALAEDLRMPLYRWHMKTWSAGRSLEDGDLEAAERLAGDALDIGQKTDQEAAMFVHGAQLAILRWFGGRFEELEPAVVAFAEAYSWVGAWRMGLLLFYADAGRMEETRTGFEQAARHDFADIPRDAAWLGAMWCLAVPCAVVGDAPGARVLYDLLRPYADRDVVIGAIAASFGPVEFPLGVFAAVAGDGARAKVHFERAIEHCERTGNRPMAALAMREYAAALLALGDLRGARRRLGDAVEVMREHGFDGLMVRAQIVTERLERLEAEANGFRREAQRWLVRWSGHEKRFAGVKGFGYLHELLRQPGREVHVLDLVASIEGATPERAALRGDAGPVIDEEAKASYRSRISELEAEVEEATAWNDPERAAAAKQEIEAIIAELARGLGLGGRHRRAGSNAERARVNVSRAIRTAIARIAEEHPEAGAHLEDAVRTGTFCVYDPPEPVHWLL